MASCGLGGRTGEGAIHSGRSPITASVDLAAEIVGLPRAEVPAERFSFVLHAPLVLMARSAHLPYVGLRLEGPLVSVPYVRLTEAVMAAFGVEVDDLAVAPTAYTATDYRVEPDATAASYFLAAAAITGGRVRIDGLGTSSAQGDARFADVLEQMGATVDRTLTSITVTGSDRLRGVDVYDGFMVQPGKPKPTLSRTYDDHRMAMSFALIGLHSPGIEIADPGCVAKTYPHYFNDLERLAGHP